VRPTIPNASTRKRKEAVSDVTRDAAREEAVELAAPASSTLWDAAIPGYQSGASAVDVDEQMWVIAAYVNRLAVA
jgi:hypothetical protein